MQQSLHLYEKIFLLSLKDKEGIIYSSVHYPQALAGAIVAELLLSGGVKIEEHGRKMFLICDHAVSYHDALLDECLNKIASAKRRAQIKTYVQRFANMKKLKKRVATQLCRKGILKEKEEKVLFLFRHKVFPEIDHRAEAEVIRNMDKAIFGNARSINPETIVLISICKSAGLLTKLFGRKEIKEKKERIKKIIEGEMVGKATGEAIAAMQAAIMAAVIVPTVATAAVS